MISLSSAATAMLSPLSLHDALPISRTDHSRGRLLVKKSTTLIMAGDYEPALAVLREAEPLRSEEHTSELQSPCNFVCRLLLEENKNMLHVLWRVCLRDSIHL